MNSVRQLQNSTKGIQTPICTLGFLRRLENHSAERQHRLDGSVGGRVGRHPRCEGYGVREQGVTVSGRDKGALLGAVVEVTILTMGATWALSTC